MNIKTIYKNIDKEIKQNLNKLIDYKKWNIYRDEFNNKVEDKCSKIINARCLTTNSGSSSLEMCLKVLNIKKGDEVIIPSFTFIATAQAILEVGATPVICKTNKDTFNLDVKEVKKCVTKKTKAIIFVHLFGNPTGIKEVNNYCKKNNIFLVEDCAQAFGAKYKNRSVGTFGECSAFSFNSCKHISCGDGGLFVTKSKKIYRLAKAIRHAGLIQNYQGEFISKYVGGKNLLTEFQAAILLPQLKNWDKLLKNRKINAENAINNLKKYDFIKLQNIKKDYYSSYQRIVFLVKNKKQAENLLEKNKFLERIYPLPLIKEPIIKKLGKFNESTKKESIDFWNKHIGFTYNPFTDYRRFSKNLKIKE